MAGTTRAEDAQRTPTLSHTSPRILIYDDDGVVEDGGGTPLARRWGVSAGDISAWISGLDGDLTRKKPPTALEQP